MTFSPSQFKLEKHFVPGNWTQGRKIVGTDGSTELWRFPTRRSYSNLQFVFENSFSWLKTWSKNLLNWFSTDQAIDLDVSKSVDPNDMMTIPASWKLGLEDAVTGSPRCDTRPAIGRELLRRVAARNLYVTDRPFGSPLLDRSLYSNQIN